MALSKPLPLYRPHSPLQYNEGARPLANPRTPLQECLTLVASYSLIKPFRPTVGVPYMDLIVRQSFLMLS